MIPLARFLKQNPNLNHRTPRIQFTPAHFNSHAAVVAELERTAAADLAAAPAPTYGTQHTVAGRKVLTDAERRARGKTYMRNYRKNNERYRAKKAAQ